MIVNASEILLPQKNGRGVERLQNAVVYVENGRIAFVGPKSGLPPAAKGAPSVDAQNGAVLPALVDAHTHLVFAGDRLEDFTARSAGTTYAEIAARGGGILTTVTATRAAKKEQLLGLTRARLEQKKRYGIGTVEVKSGYGLTVDDELKMLEVVAALKTEGYDLEGTLLAAHAIPKDQPRAEYIASIVERMIPAVAERGLARFVDVFVETHAYTLDEARLIFAAAAKHGLIPRLHADQLSAGGGAGLAAEVKAASADHLEHTSDADLAKMAAAGVVAMLLPSAMSFLGDSAKGLGNRLRTAGVEVAVATDTNPGSSPSANLGLAATLAVTTMGLTVDEALRAITLGGAHALRRDDVGHLEVGAKARFAILNQKDARALVYAYGEPVVDRLVEI
ncbi:MAG: imidazolonepropionase [Myxococcota bacterium]